jgi:hypothetical protein
MKKSELKKLIKPIVEECMQEVVLESGLISNVVAEVMKGMMPVLNEVRTVEQPKKEVKETFRVVNGKDFTLNPEHEPATISEMKKKRGEHLKEIAGEAYGSLGKMKIGGVNIFEGTEAALPDVNPMGGALASANPKDPGVNLAAFGIKGKIKQIK